MTHTVKKMNVRLLMAASVFIAFSFGTATVSFAQDTTPPAEKQSKDCVDGYDSDDNPCEEVEVNDKKNSTEGDTYGKESHMDDVIENTVVLAKGSGGTTSEDDEKTATEPLPDRKSLDEEEYTCDDVEALEAEYEKAVNEYNTLAEGYNTSSTFKADKIFAANQLVIQNMGGKKVNQTKLDQAETLLEHQRKMQTALNALFEEALSIKEKLKAAQADCEETTGTKKPTPALDNLKFYTGR